MSGDPMTDDAGGPGGSGELAAALADVRAFLAGAGVSERIVAWAMIIEAVNRLTEWHGPAATAGLLDELGGAVREAGRPRIH